MQLNGVIETVKGQRIESETINIKNQGDLIEKSKQEINDEEGLLGFEQLTKKRKSDNSGKLFISYFRF